jgi:hypothetical protein
MLIWESFGDFVIAGSFLSVRTAPLQGRRYRPGAKVSNNPLRIKGLIGQAGFQLHLLPAERIRLVVGLSASVKACQPSSVNRQRAKQ